MNNKTDLAPNKLEALFQNMMDRARANATINASEAIQSNLHDNHDAPPCLCHGNLFFIKPLAEQRLYEICPRCNPRRTCNLCAGSGHRKRLNPETAEPELIPLGCDCVISEQRVLLMNAAQIPEKYLRAEFSIENVFHGYSHVSEEMAEKFSQNEKLIMQFSADAHQYIKEGVKPGDHFFLTLTGPVGTGKTYLGICALKNLIWDYGHTGRFIDFQTLLRQIRDTYSKKGSEDDILRPLRTVEVLMIDEFGKGRTENEWELGILDDLVNSRYNSGRATIITTNYLPPELHSALRRGDKNQSTNAWYTQTTTEAHAHPSESYWVQSLPQRIGERLYDRILEVSQFVDFLGIPSFRRRASEDFLARYRKVMASNKSNPDNNSNPT